MKIFLASAIHLEFNASDVPNITAKKDVIISAGAASIKKALTKEHAAGLNYLVTVMMFCELAATSRNTAKHSGSSDSIGQSRGEELGPNIHLPLASSASLPEPVTESLRVLTLF